MGRQATRFASLIEAPVVPVGVDSDLEAAGNLIDMLDAAGGDMGAIIANVAPRNHSTKAKDNGSQFAYFYYQDTLVIATVEGLTLSLVRKLFLTEFIHVFSIEELASKVGDKIGWGEDNLDRIVNTQFRSYEALPHLAKYLLGGGSIPYTQMSTAELEPPPRTIWWVDNFGNCKTTILPYEVNFAVGKFLSSRVGEFNYYQALKDVPLGEKAAVIGSSGIHNTRLLELTLQGDNLALQNNLSVGMKLLRDID